MKKARTKSKKGGKHSVPRLSNEQNGKVLSSLTCRKAKSHKGRKILEQREPQIHETAKRCLFLRGSKCNLDARELLNDLCMLRKPFGRSLARKQEGVDAFRDSEPLEFLTQKNECALFCLGLVFGRLYERTILDMYEVHITDYIPLKSFAKRQQPLLGSKPLVVAQGAEFENSELMKSFRNYLLDHFSFGKSNKMLLKGVDQLITLTAIPSPEQEITGAALPPAATIHPRVLFRRYRVTQLQTAASQMPDVSLEEVGPSFTMALERSHLPDLDKWKSSIKLPKEVKQAKVKNISTTNMGDTVGRVHVGTVDFSKLHTPHGH